MPRKSILEVMEDILKLLSDGNEYSVQSISEKINSQWKTTIKALEFLKKINKVKERKGNKTYREERLFKSIK